MAQAEAEGIRKEAEALGKMGGDAYVKMQVAKQFAKKKILIVPGSNVSTMNVNEMVDYLVGASGEPRSPPRRLRLLPSSRSRRSEAPRPPLGPEGAEGSSIRANEARRSVPDMRTVTFVVAAAAIAALSLGCTKNQTSSGAQEPAGKAEPASVALAGGHPGASPQAMPASHPEMGSAAPASSLTGTVLETMDAAGYTYMKLKTAQGETWAAVNQTKVEKGATVTVANPMPMDGFESKTLNRKFEHIVFGTLARPARRPPRPWPRSTPPPPAARPTCGDESPRRSPSRRPPGPDGRTVAQVFAERVALKGKTVSVRGKVVKFNGGIMGRNWIHLRDGSGSRGEEGQRPHRHDDRRGRGRRRRHRDGRRRHRQGLRGGLRLPRHRRELEGRQVAAGSRGDARAGYGRKRRASSGGRRGQADSGRGKRRSRNRATRS